MEFKHINALINKLDFLPNLSPILTNLDLIRILMPNLVQTNEKSSAMKSRSILFFINLLAYDLNLCIELQKMFGNRESFRNHNRVMLKNLFDYCQIYGRHGKNHGCAVDADHCESQEISSLTCVGDNEPSLVYHETPPPLKKLFKNSCSEFLIALKNYEEANGDESHLKWCKHFLVVN